MKSIPPQPPPGIPTRVWIVIRPNGERHLIDREPLEGIVAWAKGTDATVVEHRFNAVVYAPPKKATPKKGPPIGNQRARLPYDGT